MSLVPWSRPNRSPAVRQSSELDEIFRSFFEGLPRWPAQMTNDFSPSVDVKDEEKEIVVTAELPGIDKSEVDVQVRGDELVLRGEKREEKTEETGNWVRKEIVSGSFVRRITLPAEVDAENADAKMDNGVLTIHFPKRSDTKSRSIKVA